MATPLCPESCVEPQLPHVCPPSHELSPHTQQVPRGPMSPSPDFPSPLPSLFCPPKHQFNHPSLMSSLSSLFISSLLPSPLPPSLCPHPPMWFQSPCPRVHSDLPLCPGHDETAVPTAPLTVTYILAGYLGSITSADLPHTLGNSWSCCLLRTAKPA